MRRALSQWTARRHVLCLLRHQPWTSMAPSTLPLGGARGMSTATPGAYASPPSSFDTEASRLAMSTSTRGDSRCVQEEASIVKPQDKYDDGDAAKVRPPSTTAPDTFAPWEVRALVLSLLPPAVPGVAAAPAKDILYQLPTAVQKQLQRHPGGLPAYCLEHFSSDVEVGEHTNSLRRRQGVRTVSAEIPCKGAADKGARVDTTPPPPPKAASTYAAPTLGDPASGASGGSRLPFRPGRAYTTIELLDALVEYLPTFFVTADAVAMTIPSEIQALYADTSFSFFLKRFRHYVDIRTSHGHSEVRLKPDFDHPKRGLADEHHGGGLGGRFGAPLLQARSRAADGNGQPPTQQQHPTSSSPLSASSTTRNAEDTREGLLSLGAAAALARPPRNSAANLIQYLVPRIPKEPTPLAEVLQEISDIVSRHPSFDPRLGITGFLEKYPEYFQLVDGKLRARPYKSAPNSLDDLDADTSPLPSVFSKVQALVDRAAEGRNYLEEADKLAATVPTGRLYAQLTDEEKRLVKERCRSFPRFLRLHGKAVVVSVDNMKVYKFKPEYEPCAETVLERRLAMNAISPDDPILKIPAEMDEKTNADWAVKELYDSLPLTQCAELEDVLSLVPPAVKDALPKDLDILVSEVLDQYPDYFLTWRYPDDESILVIQRAKVVIPNFDAQAIVRMTYPLIPQGGIELATLRKRVPLPLQRYFYRHGTKKALGALPQHFRLAGERIIRLG